MKKIAILTFHDACNYGAFLQAKALSEYIGQLPNVKAYVLNYKNKKVEDNYSVKGIFFSSKSLKQALLKILRIKDIIKRNRIFHKYQNESFDFVDINELEKVNICKVIVGSDQVWNLNLTGNDLNYFLPFVKPECRVSYAASAGQVKNNMDKNVLKKELKDFSAVSVREQELCDLINELDGSCKATMCIDPVFLKTKQEWIEYAKVPRTHMDFPYVLVFIMGVSKQADKVVNCAVEYARKHQESVFLVGDQERWYKYRNVKHYGVASPREFINLIDGASCVFTNSFHATAFSIILKTPFYTEINIRNSERIEHLLEITGLVPRSMYDGKIDTSNMSEIDWKKVEEKLKSEIEVSKSYLMNVIEGDCTIE